MSGLASFLLFAAVLFLMMQFACGAHVIGTGRSAGAYSHALSGDSMECSRNASPNPVADSANLPRTLDGKVS
jgi:hypothetical protein